MRHFLALALFTLSLWALAPPGPAQPPRTYEPFAPTTEYVQGMALVSQGKHEEAVAHWKDIAARHPGTTLAAECLFKAAYYSSRADGGAEAGYRSISQLFPGSRFDIEARQALINLQFGYKNMSGRAQATQELIRSFGAPTVADLQGSGDRGRWVQRYQALPQEIRQGLVAPYCELLAQLVIQLKRYDEALPLVLFYREAVVHDERTHGLGAGCLRVVLERGKPAPYLPDLLNPKVIVKSPKEGQRKGPRPRFRARVQVGDFRYNQVELGRIQFLVDGIDRRSELVIRSKVDPKLEEGRVFEKLKLSWRPAQPLPSGRHTIALTVQVEGHQLDSISGKVTVERTFEVKGDRDDPEDEKEDDQDDWD